jgi:hypothetical protein
VAYSAELTYDVDTLTLTTDSATAVDASALHHHDGRYFTETELGSNANGAGASLIGIEDASSQFTSTNVEGALDEALDAAQAAQASADANTSDVSDLRTTTGTSDGDTSMGTFTGTIIPDSVSTKAGMQALETDLEALQTLSGSSAESTNHGAFTGSTLSDTETTRSGLQTLETAVEANAALIGGLEWQDSALDYVTDNTAVPATEVSGDRYILSHDGGAPHANWDGASAGDIVEFDGTSWVVTAPTTGMFISADDEPTLLYYWGGSAWSTKLFESTTASTGLVKSGVDIRLADAAENASGIKVLSGVITLEDLGAFDTDGLAEGSANLYFTDGRAQTAAVEDDVYGVGWDGDTIHAPSQNAVYDKIESLDAADISYTPSVLTDWDGDADPGDTDAALDQLAERVDDLELEGASAESMTEAFDAGETLTAGVRAVRFAKAADAVTLGRVMLAGQDTTSADDFYAVGLLVATGETAGTSVSVTKAGSLTATAHGLTVGEPFYLTASGALTNTAPTTALHAVVKLGVAKDANTLEVQVQTMGIN